MFEAKVVYVVFGYGSGSERRLLLVVGFVADQGD